MFVIILLSYAGCIQMATLIHEKFQNISTLYSSLVPNQTNSDLDLNTSFNESVIFGDGDGDEDEDVEEIKKNEYFEDNEDIDEIHTYTRARSQMKSSFSDLTLSMYSFLAENNKDNFVFSPLR